MAVVHSELRLRGFMMVSVWEATVLTVGRQGSQECTDFWQRQLVMICVALSWWNGCWLKIL